MKKSFLCFFLISLFIQSNGQISILSSDMPVAGDTIRKSVLYTDEGFDFSQTGENFEWDYSTLGFLVQQVDTFANPTEAPIFYQVVFIPVLVTNLARKLSEFTWIPGFEVTDVYNFYKNSQSDFRDVGFGFTVAGIPVPLKYSQPDLIYQFPVEYGNVDSSNSGYVIDLGIAYVSGWKKRKNTADGWGLLKTPYGEFEVLRIKTDLVTFDSIYIDSLGMGIPVTRNITEYKWLGKNSAIPLLEVTIEGLLTTVQYRDSVRNPYAGIGQIVSSEKNYRIFPVPACDWIYIDAENQASHTNYFVTLLNVRGQNMIQPVRFDNGTVKINVGSIPSGVYFVVIKNDNRIVFHKKLIIG